MNIHKYRKKDRVRYIQKERKKERQPEIDKGRENFFSIRFELDQQDLSRCAL